MIDPIIITGAARSGTSMTAGIIQICGAFGGDTQKPNKNNPKGMFENLVIRKQLIKPFLKSIGADPMAQRPLPKIQQLYDIIENDEFIGSNWYNRIYYVMQNQGYTTGHWYIKEPKICLIWPIFAEAFPKAKWVIVRRKDEDVINSCLRTGFMSKYNNYVGWYKWFQVHERRLQEILNSEYDSMEIWPQQLIDGDFNKMKSIINWLGLNWEEEEIKNFVDKNLWKKRTGK